MALALPVTVKAVVRLVRLSVLLVPVSSSGSSLNSVGAAMPVVRITSERICTSGLVLPALSTRRTFKLV